MAQQRRRVKSEATFEERLAEEAIKFKEAAEKPQRISPRSRGCGPSASNE